MRHHPHHRRRAMDDQNHELREYHEMKRWLAGEHPSAQGRTWRRVLHAKAEAVLPPAVMRTVDTAIRWTPQINGAYLFVQGWVGMMLYGITRPMLSFLMETTTQTDPFVTPIGPIVHSLFTTVEPIVLGVATLAMVFGGVCFLVNGK
jgi:hypothetical protein